MHIYLPIAGLSVNILSLLALGGGVGFISGLFGVGGGFLLMPLLIFMGVPSPVAVASGANQVVGASFSGALVHWRRGNVDLKMGVMLVLGGLLGSLLGVALFTWLHALGQIDLAITLSYVVFLGFVGITMLIESGRALILSRRPRPRHKRHRHMGANLPFRMRFPRSGLYIPLPLVLGVGALGGMLSALMGVGGGFIMVPLMIYILEMPTAVVIGTSLFQVVFITAVVTVMQSVQTQTVDAVLMLTLLAGGAVGAQVGARFGHRLRAEHMRILLALIVLTLCGRLLLDLTRTPAEAYSLVGKLAG